MKKKIAYYGEERDGYGTFGHKASFKVGNKDDIRIGIPSFPGLINAVITGEVDMSTIPTENFFVGGVKPSTDSIIHANGNFKISGKIIIQVHHNLISMKPMPLAHVKKVLSFSQATPQCRKWLKKNLPHLAEIDESPRNTADAVRRLKDCGEGTAAIGTLMSADYYGGAVLAENIHDHADNATSFFVLSRDNEKSPTGNDETSLIFFVPDRPGTLYCVLGFFAKENINLSRIESSPTHKKFGEYIFFVTIDGHKDDPNVKRALTKLSEYADFVKVLGSYPKFY